jgi:hypothetical protein
MRALDTRGGAAMFPLLETRSRRAHAVSAVIVTAVAALSIGRLMVRGWVPFDEGALGQSADRVLLGQLPHRDFDEIYTGGLSIVHALAFRLLGENLVSMRLVLFAAIVAATPALYYIASRFTAPAIAAAVSIAAFLASFPSYPAPLPSWYNLVFALFASAALMRFLEARSRRWLLVAGLAAGTSVLFKIVGLWLIDAIALFLIFDAHTTAPEGRSTPPRRTIYALPVGVIILTLAAGPLVLMRSRLRAAELVELAVPVVAVCVAVATEVYRAFLKGESSRALIRLVATAWPFMLGVALPLLCFVVPYVMTGAVGSLYRGVFVLPQERLAWAAADGPPVMAMLLGLPPLYLMTSARFSRTVLRRHEVLTIIGLEVALVALSVLSLNTTAVLWSVVRMTAPVLVIGAAVVVAASEKGGGGSLHRQQLLLLASTASWCALVQFPMDTYQYFLYVLPLFVLLATAVTTVRGTLDRSVALSTLSAFLVLAVLLRPAYIGRAGGESVTLTGQEAATLDLTRGGLTIRREERDEYLRVVAAIREHSRSRFIYVSPDAPEVYFLAERENPTRTLFDFFEDPQGRTDRVLAAVSQRDVDVVVINKKPRFSGPMPADLYDSLATRFTASAETERFEVRWRR